MAAPARPDHLRVLPPIIFDNFYNLIRRFDERHAPATRRDGNGP